MDDIAVDSDKLSSILDDELISNITRPSLVSFSSEDSLNQENIALDTVFIDAGITKSSASPLKTSTSEHSSSHENTGNEDYEFKRPAKFSTGKRYSITIMNDIQNAYNVNKSNSMLDVSSLMSYSPLRRDSYMYSNETLQSNSIATTKSKDSGFQRSTSCTSLTTTGSKKYDHVQSKVKQYIQTIKQTEAVRKMQKRIENRVLYRGAVESSSLESPESSPLSNADTSVSKKDLMNKVKELEDELKEKECVIEQLEKNQSELRLKYAAAENRIDDLRIRASQNEEPMKSYITDEKVAELLMSSAKNSRRYSENGITRRSQNDGREGAARYDASNFVRPEVDSYGREIPQSMNTLFSNSPLRSEVEVSRSSSYKHVTEPNYLLSKSASNIERTLPITRLVESDMKNIPYEKNPFAKVEQWQRSLVNLNRVNDERILNMCCAPTDDTFYMYDDSLDESQMKKSRRYQKNKDADKVRYRQSYPVGCKCEKFKKCRSKEDLSTSPPTQLATNRRKFRRTVSFASYEDSLTSSVYDDDESTSDERTEVADGAPIRHESYKRYKQRKLQEKLMKDGREFMPAWNEIKKARSAGNIHRGDVAASATILSTMQNRHKRVMDCQTAGGIGCGQHPCTDRKHCAKVHSKKYRKLDDCSKIATSSGCHALMKPQSVIPVHGCRPSTSYEIMNGVKAVNCLPHSKSFDDHRRGCGTRDRGHRMDKVECSCLLALENLNLRDHRVLAKLAEQSCMYPSRKLKKEKESTLAGMSKLCLLQK